jgi:hypothetical protein
VITKATADTLIGMRFPDPDDGTEMEILAVALDTRHDAGIGVPDRSGVRAQRVGNTDPDDFVVYGLFDVLNEVNV